MCYGISLYSVGVSSPSYFPSEILTKPLTLGGGMEEKALTLCKHYSATAKTLACYPQCFSHKHKAQHHMGSYDES